MEFFSKKLITAVFPMAVVLAFFFTCPERKAAAPDQSWATPTQWQAVVRIDFPPEAFDRQDRLDGLLSESLGRKLEAERIRHTWRKHIAPDRSLSYSLSMTGSQGRDQFRKALFAATDPTLPFTPGPALLQLQGDLRSGEFLDITLEANLASGYSWEILGLGNAALREQGPAAWTSPESRLGGSQRHVIRLEGLQEGKTALAFLYRRPWIDDHQPRKTITIKADRLAVISDLSDPAPVTVKKEQPIPTAPPLNPAPVLGLPTAWDWRDSGILTPVKDQGNCGSCWAFGTVGPLEANLLWKSNLTRDLSEEFLLSCNTDGYSCNGGWWAHEYHFNKLGINQTQVGAVLEADFPYVASKQSCSLAFNHPYRLGNWGYVGDDSSTPAVEAIKNALATYGPVAVAVCSGPAMQGYRGGVFRTDERYYCAGGVNHAVVLVGWNDAENTWIMRNSWGSSWGENGYMRIVRGTSNIGYSANYIVYSQPFTARYWYYFPLALHNPVQPPPPSLVLKNGDFESGRDGSWTESSTNGFDLILTEAEGLTVTPHSALWAAWLGGSDYEISTLSQRIAIPANAQTLGFYYWIGSEDYCSFDQAEVRLGSQTLATYDLCAEKNTGGWISQTLDLSGYRGQTLDLVFSTTTDYSLNSNFFLDDVTLSTTAGVQPIYPSPRPEPGSSADPVRPKNR